MKQIFQHIAAKVILPRTVHRIIVGNELAIQEIAVKF